MRKYSIVTQELANVLPTWSAIRFDEQSVGQRLFNSFALELEDVQNEMIRHGKNYHIATANLKELDWLYRVELPSTFEFTETGSDTFQTAYDPPVVSGQIGGVWRTVDVAEDNDLCSFWYEHVPDRISLGAAYSGDYHLLDDIADNTPFSGVFIPYKPGRLSVDLSGGTQYISIDDDKTIKRAQVIISGTTRGGVEETETLAFPWDQSQSTFKEWESVDAINCLNIEDGVAINVRMGDFACGPYLDFWNIAVSPYRRKIDCFWDVTSSAYGTTLDRLQYSTDDIRDMLNGLFTRYNERRWELLDTGGQSISAIDMAQQPFSDYIWAVSDSKLYCYSRFLTTVEDVAPLMDSSENRKVYIEFSEDHTVRGEEIEVLFTNPDYQNKVFSYQAWVELPDGSMSGILNGSFVTYVAGAKTYTNLYREFVDKIVFEPDQLGEYVFCFEAVMSDGETHVCKRVLSVDSKTALAEFSLPSGVLGVVGIDFDSDQDLVVATNSGYYTIIFHHDVMLVDYDGAVIYFREPYDTVNVS